MHMQSIEQKIFKDWLYIFKNLSLQSNAYLKEIIYEQDKSITPFLLKNFNCGWKAETHKLNFNENIATKIFNTDILIGNNIVDRVIAEKYCSLLGISYKNINEDWISRQIFWESIYENEFFLKELLTKALSFFKKYPPDFILVLNSYQPKEYSSSTKHQHLITTKFMSQLKEILINEDFIDLKEITPKTDTWIIVKKA
jgi:hypothetical protein